MQRRTPAICWPYSLLLLARALSVFIPLEPLRIKLSSRFISLKISAYKILACQPCILVYHCLVNSGTHSECALDVCCPSLCKLDGQVAETFLLASQDALEHLILYNIYRYAKLLNIYEKGLELQ